MSKRADRRRSSGRPSDPSAEFVKTGLLVLFVLVPLVYHSDLFLFALLPKRFALQAGLLAVTAAFLVLKPSGSETGIPHTSLTLPVVCYVLITCLTLGLSTNAVSGILSMGHMLTFVLLFFIVSVAFPARDILLLFKAVACVGIFVSVLGILESRGFDMSWLPSNGRPSATFGYRNFAATYLAMAIPYTLLLWWKGRSTREVALGAIASGTMLVFLVYTRTRGAWGGLTGALAVAALTWLVARRFWQVRFDIVGQMTQASRFKIGIGVLACILPLAMLSPQVASPQARAIDERKVELLDALTSVTGSSADRGRRVMRKHTVEMIRDYPLGVGPGNWSIIYPEYDGGDMLFQGSAPERPHNDFLWIASETGIPGLLCYIWILLAVAGIGYRILRSPRRPSDPVVALAIGASCLAMLGHSIFSFPRERIGGPMLFWTGLALLTLLDPQKPKRSDTPLSGLILRGFPVLLLLLCWITWRQMKFDASYLEAREYYKGEDLRATLIASGAALDIGPFDVQAFLLRAKGHQAVDRVRNALEDCREGLRYHPNSLEILGDMGTYYAMLDSLDQAENAYRRVLALSPRHFRVHNNLGGVYAKRGDYPLAIESYRKAIAQDPKYVDAYSNLGLAHLEIGEPGLAVDAFLNGIKAAPKDAVLHHNLGDAYFALWKEDPSALSQAAKAYHRFLQTWRGPVGQATLARERLAQIDSLRSGAP